MPKKDFTDSINNRDSKTENPFIAQKESNNVNTLNTSNLVNTKNTLNTNKVMKTFRIDRNLAKKLRDKTFDLRMSQTEIVEQALKDFLQ